MRAALLKSAKRIRRARQWQPDQRPQAAHVTTRHRGDGSPAAYDTLSVRITLTESPVGKRKLYDKNGDEVKQKP